MWFLNVLAMVGLLIIIAGGVVVLVGGLAQLFSNK